MTSLETLLEECRALAQQSDRLVCDLASGKKKWEMCVPPQPSDTDMVLTRLSRESVPKLVEMLEVAIKSMERYARSHFECDDGWYSCPMAENYIQEDKESRCTCGKGYFEEALSELEALAKVLIELRRQ